MVNNEEENYLLLAKEIVTTGSERMDRTGVGTRALFGTRLQFSLKDGQIPLLTTKKMFTKAIIHELLWFIKGHDNIQYLKDQNVTIWDEWAKENGDVGPIYGYQWRKWRQYREIEDGVRVTYIDQLLEAIKLIIHNPYSRRIMVNAWNVSDIDQMALPPCHYGFQFFCRPIPESERQLLTETHLLNKGVPNTRITPDKDYQFTDNDMNELNIPKNYLSCMFNMRSIDVALGLPFNIASYAMLTHMIAQITNTVPEKLIFIGGDTHVYLNHTEGLLEQAKRDAKPFPKLILNKDVRDIDEFMFHDFKIEGYESHPKIEFPIAV